MKAHHIIGSILTILIFVLIGMVLAPVVGWPAIGSMKWRKKGTDGKMGSQTLATGVTAGGN